MAFAAREGIGLEPWGDGSVPRLNGIMEEARASIAAMLVPTPEMEDAARALGCASGKAMYAAAIDAALAEGTPTT